MWIAGLEQDSITNGPGLRFVIFTQGCPHHCVGCHNPQTHEIGIGTQMSADALFAKIKANPLTKGVTFSGGEPFLQAEELADLGERLKESGYEVAVYSGWTFEELLEKSKREPGVKRLLSCSDVLIDGRFRLEEKSLDLRFRGSANQRILDVQKSLRTGQAVLMPKGRWQK